MVLATRSEAHLDILRPIRLLLLTYGFDVVPEGRNCSCRRRRLRLALLAFHLLILTPAALISSTLRTEAFVHQVLTNGLKSGNSLLLAINSLLFSTRVTYFVFLLRHDRLRRLLLHLVASNSGRLRRRMWALAFAGFSVHALSTSITVITVRDLIVGNNEAHLNQTLAVLHFCPRCPGAVLLSMPQGLHVQLVCQILDFVYFLPFLLVNFLLFIAVLLLLLDRFQQLQKWTVEHWARPPDSALSTFQGLHHWCCRLVAETGSFYGGPVLIWIVLEFQTILLLLRCTLMSTQELTRWSYSPTIAGLLLGVQGLFFLGKCLACAAVNSMVFDSLNSLDLQNGFGGRSSVVLAQFQLYTTRLTISTPAITACGFFVISKGFIVSVAGTLLTYSLVLREFS